MKRLAIIATMAATLMLVATAVSAVPITKADDYAVRYDADYVAVPNEILSVEAPETNFASGGTFTVESFEYGYPYEDNGPEKQIVNTLG